MKQLGLFISSVVIFLNVAIGQMKSKTDVERMLITSDNKTARSILNDVHIANKWFDKIYS